MHNGPFFVVVVAAVAAVAVVAVVVVNPTPKWRTIDAK